MKSPALPPVPYCGRAPAPEAVWSAWNWDPALLFLLAVGFAAGIVQFRRMPRQRLVWTAGCAALLVAFVSPLCALTSGLFAVRSIHHLLVVVVAAPLFGAVLAQRCRLMPLGLLTGVSILIFWVWHMPAAYAAALSSTFIYWTMQALLLGSAVLFWGAIYSARTLAGQIGALLVVTLQMGLLGAIITFMPQPLYAPHFLTAPLYGLSALEDQQLAGLIMWIGGQPLVLAAGAPLLRRLSGLNKAPA